MIKELHKRVCCWAFSTYVSCGVLDVANLWASFFNNVRTWPIIKADANTSASKSPLFTVPCHSDNTFIGHVLHTHPTANKYSLPCQETHLAVSSNGSSACILSDFGMWDIWCNVGQRVQSAPCSSPLLGMFVERRITYNLHKLARKHKTLWKALFRMPSNIKSSVDTRDEGKGKKKTFGKSTTAAIGRIATVASWSLCADIPGTDSC